MPKILEEITVSAPAKINIHLAVKDKRTDGFHNLESIFLALDFGDTLHFYLQNDEDSPCSSLKDEIAEAVPKLQSLGQIPVVGSKIKDNIIYKAISLFKEKTGLSCTVKVFMEKRIPVGGGLGGGSSDAAAALLALNKITGFPLSRQTLLEMAAVLGSDVPFFVNESPAALVTGRGEYIEPIKAPPLFFTLVNPGFSSSTARAFRLLDEYRSKNPCWAAAADSMPALSPCQINFDNNSFSNDFSEIFPQEEKDIYFEIICQLKEQGSLYANLSGTGSTCFGVFNNETQAKAAAKTLHGKWPFVQYCFLKNLHILHKNPSITGNF